MKQLFRVVFPASVTKAWRSWRARAGRPSAGCLPSVRLESEHKAKDSLEQHRRGQLIASEVLIHGKLRVRVKGHPMKVTFDSRRKHDALVTGVGGIGGGAA